MDKDNTQDLLSNNTINISKIKLPNGELYDIKDSLLRHQLNVLLGIEEPDERDS